MTKNYNDMYTILDLNACILHSYHGAVDDDPIIGRDGQDIKNAHCGFNAFLDLYIKPTLEDFQPRQILAVIDRGTDYQSAIFEDYKAERKEKKAEKDPLEGVEINKLKDFCKRFILQLGCTIVGVKGVEADDVVGYLCDKLPGYKRVHSVDTDFLQMLAWSDDIDLMLKGELIDVSLGGHKCGDSAEEVPFDLWPLFRSIVGKKSDGYKGIPRLGKAAWTKLREGVSHEDLLKLQQGVISKDWKVLREVSGIPEKTLEKMDEHRTDWGICMALALLQTDLCWKPRSRKIPKLELIKRVGDLPTLSKVMRMADSEDRISEFEDYLPQEWLIDANNFEESDIADFAEEVKRSPHVSFDYESWSEHAEREEFSKAAKGRLYVDVLSQKITGVSFNFGANLQYTFYLTVDHLDSANLPKEVITRLLAAIPDDKVLVAQNAPFEITLTKTNLGVTLEDLHDTKIMQVYVDEEAETGLKKQSKTHLNYSQVDYLTVTGGKGMNEITAEHATGYGCDDSTVTGRLYDSHKLIMLLEDTWNLYIASEPLCDNVTAHSYIQGNRMDWDFLTDMHKRDEQNYTDAYLEVHKLMGSHCTEPVAANALGFFKADEDFERKALREKFKVDRTKLSSDCLPSNLTIEGCSFADYWHHYKIRKLETLTEKTVYTPFKTTVTMKEFIPTKGNLYNMLERLGFDSKPQSYSIKNIRAWVDQHLVINWETGEGAVKHEEFLHALMGASKNIVKASERSGVEYAKFIKLCSMFLDESDEVITTSGDELSVGSPKQIQELMYLKMGLPVRLHSKVAPGSKRAELGVKGSPSTNDNAINWALAEDMDGPDDWRIPVLTKFKEAKGIRTQIGLFDIPYPLWRHPDDGKIHPGIINCGAKATKRMSGSSPNVMQVSGKTDMRDAFLPNSDDEVLVGIDWSGQELRITAAECQDPTMLSAYVGKAEELRDLHSLTGAGVAGWEYKEFYKAYSEEGHKDHHYVYEVRKSAKAINFGIIYGMSALALAQRLIIPQVEADKMMDNTYATYPGLMLWQKAVVGYAKKNGFVTTFFGGKKHAHPDLFSQDNSKRSRVERQLINFKVQGCAANMLKRLFTMMWQTGIIQDLGVSFILPIHDEVLASVPRKHLFEYIRRTSQLMRLAVPGCSVPMEVDVAISGISWGHMKEIGANPTQSDIDNALAKEAA